MADAENIIDLTDLGQRFSEQIDSFARGELDADGFGDAYRALVEEGGERISGEVVGQAQKTAVTEEAELAPFLIRLRARWRPALELLASHRGYALQAGETFNEEYEDDAIENQDVMFFALRLLHAQACRIAGEVRVLLASGHASGALARWRALYESAVISSLLGMQGNNDIAQRFLDHAVIHDEREARWHRETFPDHRSISDGEYRELVQAKLAAVRRYPEGRYDSDYGWAVPLIGNAQPTFRDLEDSAKLSHWRPTYKVANHHVHSDARSAHATLAWRGDTRYLLSGPTNVGLAEPASHAMDSLTIVTTAFLVGNHGAQSNSPLNAISAVALGRIAQVAAAEFVRIEDEIDAEERARGRNH